MEPVTAGGGEVRAELDLTQDPVDEAAKALTPQPQPEPDLEPEAAGEGVAHKEDDGDDADGTEEEAPADPELDPELEPAPEHLLTWVDDPELEMDWGDDPKLELSDPAEAGGGRVERETEESSPETKQGDEIEQITLRTHFTDSGETGPSKGKKYDPIPVPLEPEPDAPGVLDVAVWGDRSFARRRFLEHDTVAQVAVWVGNVLGLNMETNQLWTSFPRKALEDGSLTRTQAGVNDKHTMAVTPIRWVAVLVLNHRHILCSVGGCQKFWLFLAKFIFLGSIEILLHKSNDRRKLPALHRRCFRTRARTRDARRRRTWRRTLAFRSAVCGRRRVRTEYETNSRSFSDRRLRSWSVAC